MLPGRCPSRHSPGSRTHPVQADRYTRAARRHEGQGHGQGGVRRRRAHSRDAVRHRRPPAGVRVEARVGRRHEGEGHPGSTARRRGISGHRRRRGQHLGRVRGRACADDHVARRDVRDEHAGDLSRASRACPRAPRWTRRRKATWRPPSRRRRSASGPNTRHRTSRTRQWSR